MSPPLFGCVICGYLIDAYGSALWLKEFRAVYSSVEGSFVSGVGRYADPDGGIWIAPSNPNTRWDNPNYNFPPHDVLPVMRQCPENGRHGFVLHNSCWNLLKKFFDPDNVPIERLLNICRSLPFPIRGIGVCWGHSYGGLTAFDDEDHYPWEDRLTEQQNPARTYARENPYDIAEIHELLVRSSQPPETPTPAEPVLSMSMASGKDCFAIFPWEILEAIGVNLLMPDVLSLVRASRTFFPILTSQAFWASRFEDGNDRDFLFEKRNCRESRDWAMLYQLTNRTLSPPGLKNRRRIWELIQASAPSLHSHLNKTTDSSHRKLGRFNADWREVAGNLQPDLVTNYRGRFYTGCILFCKQMALVPSGLSGMAFSVTAESVTGIRLISNNQTEIRLGYINLTSIGPQGVQAIQVISNNGHASRWLGSPMGAPFTERLTGFETITALEVGVDGYKVVSIAVTGPQSIPRPESLRATALWYPSVPSTELYLNDESFTGEDPLIAGYQPLVWIHFGGSNGIYLQSISGICVTRLGSLCCVEFEYDIEGIPAEVRKLGRRKGTDFSHVTRFEIDGHSGEFISRIAASTEFLDGENVYRFYKHGKLGSFKITTNYGRSAHFKPEGSTIDVSTLVPLSIAPGTTLTGLYASQHPEEGIVSLGVISEPVNNRKRKRKPTPSIL